MDVGTLNVLSLTCGTAFDKRLYFVPGPHPWRAGSAIVDPSAGRLDDLEGAVGGEDSFSVGLRPVEDEPGIVPRWGQDPFGNVRMCRRIASNGLYDHTPNV